MVRKQKDKRGFGGMEKHVKCNRIIGTLDNSLTKITMMIVHVSNTK